jgi:hypothetical protein
LEYFGFELESEVETVEEFPPEFAGAARHALAEALARNEARHFAVKKNREVIDNIRDAYKRSGGETKRLGLPDLVALYEQQLAPVNSMDEFKSARLDVDPSRFISDEVRAKLERLPSSVTLRDREVEIDYDVEERDGQRRGVARLRLPEKIARSLTPAEVPQLDRPVRFVVLRGQRGAVRADDLEELQALLAQPWSPDEVEESADDQAMLSHGEREVKRIAGEFRRHRRGGDHQRPGRGRQGRGGGGGGGSGRHGKPDPRRRRRGR